MPHKKRKKKQAQALAVVRATPAPLAKPEPWVLRPEQIALLKRTIAKGTTDDEFQLFLWVAKKHKLDPMTRQLHCVKRWSTALNTEVMSIQIGIDGYRSMAAVSHQDFGGVDEPEYEFDLSKKGPDNPAALVLARVRVWKKGFDHPTVGIAFWDEYKPDFSKPGTFMWKKMPKGQLAKCAEALALRKAYPDLADIYTDDEMHQADDDHAPSGRAMTRVAPLSTEPAPPGTEKMNDAQRAIVADKLQQAAEREAQRRAATRPALEQKISEGVAQAQAKLNICEYHIGAKSMFIRFGSKETTGRVMDVLMDAKGRFDTLLKCWVLGIPQGEQCLEIFKGSEKPVECFACDSNFNRLLVTA